MNIKEILLYLNYSTYVINTLTIIGSLLSFIIFSRKAFKKSTIGIYCRSLAVYDLFVCINLIVGIASIVMKELSLILDTQWICKMTTYTSSAFSAMSGWVLVFFSLDQLISVSMTQRFLFFKKKWFQYLLILGLFVFHCLIYSPYIFLSDLRNTTNNGSAPPITCYISSIALPIVLLFESSILPLTILSIVSSLIVRYLALSRKKANFSTPRSATISEHFSNASTSTNNQRAHRRTLKDYRFAFNSVILNISHIFFSSLLLIFLSLPMNDADFQFLFNTIAYLLYFINFALHFWVHFCVNSLFRKEFFILIPFKSH